MSYSDKRISAAIAATILIHFAILIVSLVTPTLSFLTLLINLAISLSICIYWIQKKIRITQRIFELREILFISLEVMVAGCSIYSILTADPIIWLRVVNFVILGIHLLLLLAFFIFMLTFKIKRLF